MNENTTGTPAEPRPSRFRRTMLLRIGVLVAVLGLLVLVPGYLATRGSFMQRYVKFSEEYTTWSQSVHTSADCQSCHVTPDRTSQIGYDLRMVGEFYVSLVAPGREPALFPKPTNAACLSCHTDLRTVSPRGDLNIPHRAHVDVLKLNCIDCHRFLVHAKSPEGSNRPAMADCLRCHNGKTAKSDCSACHRNKTPPPTHRQADWLVVHPTKASEAICGGCHAWKAHWCADCHTRRPKSHSADWRAQHGTLVAKHRDCEACHVAAFCVRCHGTLPTQNLDPNLKLVQ